MQTDPFELIQVGDEAEFERCVEQRDVQEFVSLTGDNNPLHINKEFASRTNFQEPVVHGMLTASFISTLIGTRIPGHGALWTKQTLEFLSPVRIGEKIRVVGRVKQKSEAQRSLKIETLVFGNDGRTVINGEATVKVLDVKPKRHKMKKFKVAELDAVIVTGGSRGIGAATVLALAEIGHPVILTYSSDKIGADSIADEITSQNGKAIAVQADVADPKMATDVIRLCIDQFNGLAGLVNNASPAFTIKPFEETNWDEIQHQINVQVKGAFLMSQATLPILKERGRGSIVNIVTSYLDNIPSTGLTSYLIGKSGLAQLSHILASEYGHLGIRVNAVAPGMTETSLISNLPEKSRLLDKANAPLRQLAEPHQIADTVAFLISDRSSHITGQTIRVNGGITMS